MSTERSNACPGPTSPSDTWPDEPCDRCGVYGIHHPRTGRAGFEAYAEALNESVPNGTGDANDRAVPGAVSKDAGCEPARVRGPDQVVDVAAADRDYSGVSPAGDSERAEVTGQPCTTPTSGTWRGDAPDDESFRVIGPIVLNPDVEAHVQAQAVIDTHESQLHATPTTGTWRGDAEALLEMGAKTIDAATVRGLLGESDELALSLHQRLCDRMTNSRNNAEAQYKKLTAACLNADWRLVDEVRLTLADALYWAAPSESTLPCPESDTMPCGNTVEDAVAAVRAESRSDALEAAERICRERCDEYVLAGRTAKAAAAEQCADEIAEFANMFRPSDGEAQSNCALERHSCNHCRDNGCWDGAPAPVKKATGGARPLTGAELAEKFGFKPHGKDVPNWMRAVRSHTEFTADDDKLGKVGQTGREPTCQGTIPNTVIACGEGGSYCSEGCESTKGNPEFPKMVENSSGSRAIGSVELTIPLGDGWTLARAAFRYGSFISLLYFTHAEKGEQRARLDLGKCCAIDATPVGLSKEQFDSVATWIAKVMEGNRVAEEFRAERTHLTYGDIDMIAREARRKAIEECAVFLETANLHPGTPMQWAAHLRMLAGQTGEEK